MQPAEPAAAFLKRTALDPDAAVATPQSKPARRAHEEQRGIRYFCKNISQSGGDPFLKVKLIPLRLEPTPTLRYIFYNIYRKVGVDPFLKVKLTPLEA